METYKGAKDSGDFDEKTKIENLVKQRCLLARLRSLRGQLCSII